MTNCNEHLQVNVDKYTVGHTVTHYIFHSKMFSMLCFVLFLNFSYFCFVFSFGGKVARIGHGYEGMGRCMGLGCMNVKLTTNQ